MTCQTLLAQWLLTGGRSPQWGVHKLPGGHEPLRALQHGKFDQ